MGKITISLSDEGEQMLRELAKRNVRSISKQVEYYVRKDKGRNSPTD